jgi:hypothetical protein
MTASCEGVAEVLQAAVQAVGFLLFFAAILFGSSGKLEWNRRLVYLLASTWCWNQRHDLTGNGIVNTFDVGLSVRAEPQLFAERAVAGHVTVFSFRPSRLFAILQIVDSHTVALAVAGA